MDYGRLITRAFQITIRHRFLWILGILAGGGGSFNFNYGGGPGNGGPPPEAFDRSLAWLLAHLYVIILIGIILFLIVIFFIVVSIMANGGLIASVAGIEGRQSVSFWKGMRAGYHAFWRLFAIGLLLFLVVASVIALMAAPIVILVLTEHYIPAIALGLLFIPPFIILAIYVSILSMYAYRFTVIQATGAIESLVRANYTMFASKKEVLLVWLLSLAFGLAAVVGIMIVLVVIALPAIAIGVGIYLTLGLMATIVYALGPALVLFATSLLLNGVTTTFSSSFWTLAHLDLTRPPSPPAPQPVGC